MLRSPGEDADGVHRLLDLDADPGAIDAVLGEDPVSRAAADDRHGTWLQPDTLRALPGIGPWTLGYVAMRALGDRDAFLPTDAGVRSGLAALGLPTDPRSAARRSDRWRPYRAHAMLHLWDAAHAARHPRVPPA